MNTGVKTLAPFRSFVSHRSPANPRCGRSPKGKRPEGLPPRCGAAALRLSAPIVELLLYCCCLLIPAGNSPGIPVSNLAELVQALGTREESALPGSSEIEDVEDQDGFEIDFCRRKCRVVASR